MQNVLEVGSTNPCEKCARVPNPDACDNKRCPDWQAWWQENWERTCLAILRLLNKQNNGENAYATAMADKED